MTARRVLVVDDDGDNAQLLQLLIELGGHQARTAGDGKTALAEAGDFHPDAAFVDFRLPDMSGLELGPLLRATPGLEGILLVAVTGFDAPEDKRRARDAGFDQYLVKPLDPDQVTRLLADPRP